MNVYDVDGEGWAWGQIERDGYVGYLPANALVTPGLKPDASRFCAAHVFIS